MILTIRPIEEAFKGGRLMMPSSPNPDLVSFSQQTIAIPTVLVLLSVVLIILILRDLFETVPVLCKAVFRTKVNLNYEHSIHNTIERNRIFGVMILPFCLIAYYSNTLIPSWMPSIPKHLFPIVPLAVWGSYLLLRKLLFSILRMEHMSYDERQTVHNIQKNIFIVFSILIFVSCIPMLLLGASRDATSMVFCVEVIAMTAFTMIRVFNVLRMKYSIFVSILYLCVLEIIPFGLVVFAK